MNEAVLTASAQEGESGNQRPPNPTTRKSSAFYGYSFTIMALGIGWLLRGTEFVSPKEGIGYWLGIVGGS